MYLTDTVWSAYVMYTHVLGEYVAYACVRIQHSEF